MLKSLPQDEPSGRSVGYIQTRAALHVVITPTDAYTLLSAAIGIRPGTRVTRTRRIPISTR
jgi:hypothetical protein